MTGRAVLLVEGQGDVLFFEALLRQLKVQTKISVKPPRAFDKENTVSSFPRLIKQLFGDLEDDRLDYLGVVADADHVSGGGFKERWKTLTGPMAMTGYRIPKSSPKLPCTGSIFQHDDGLPPIGLYLMPNHQDNGMLEDCLWDGLKSDSNDLKDYAVKVIDGLPCRLFSEYHITKAQLYTWLAWQKRPGQTMDVTVNGKLLDIEHEKISGLLKWMSKVFPCIKPEDFERLK